MSAFTKQAISPRFPTHGHQFGRFEWLVKPDVLDDDENTILTVTIPHGCSLEKCLRERADLEEIKTRNVGGTRCHIHYR